MPELYSNEELLIRADVNYRSSATCVIMAFILFPVNTRNTGPSIYLFRL